MDMAFYIFLMHYMSDEFIKKIENKIKVPVTLIGTGPEVWDVVDLNNSPNFLISAALLNQILPAYEFLSLYQRVYTWFNSPIFIEERHRTPPES
jgi:hypothetical protein